MDLGYTDFSAWCETVTKHVRFSPDRNAIHQELLDHYWDHVRDLKRIGYDQALAEERALAAMGDPEEVGKAMDRAHRPWLGWLWMVSRVGVTVCTLCAVVSILAQGLSLRGIWPPVQREGDYEPDGFMFLASEERRTSENMRRIMLGTGDRAVERAGERVSIPYAAVWQEEVEETYGEGFTQYWMTIVLALDDKNPLDTPPTRFKEELTVTFDDGRHYDRYYYDVRNEYDEDGNVVFGPADGYLGGLRLETDPLRALGCFYIGLGEKPGEWCEISYPYGDPWRIRIDWQEVKP